MAEQHADTDHAAPMTLGLERWVQFAFIGAAVAMIWLFDHLIEVVWDIFAEPDPTIGTVAAVVLGGAIAAALYFNAKTNQWAHDVAGELSKVTWPTRKETWAATVVVVITSIIAAIILFAFDFAWSTLTDLIYQV